MNERLPYEEQLQQQWNDLPLPDENMAWADMKRRLEEDDDDGVIVWWRRGCMLWGLLLLALFGAGWWLLKPQKWFRDKTSQQQTVVEKKGDSIQQRKNDRTIDLTNTDNSNQKVNEAPDPVSPKKEIAPSDPKQRIDIRVPATVDEKQKIVGQKKDKPNAIVNSVVTGRTSNAPKGISITKKSRRKPANDQQLKKGKEERADPVITDKVTSVTDSLAKGSDTQVTPPVDSVVIKQKTELPKKKPAIKKNTVANSEAKKDSSKMKNIFFSAGIAMQQLLPVAGQKTVPYNSLGRKGTLADYIPSVYFRLNKKDKWFLQSEFRYGAPQYTKEFVYSQQSKNDTLGGGTYTTRTTNTLKKTYYHQLPVTFNYFVMPGWSVGGGFSWNKFVSAISDNEVRRLNTTTLADSLVSKAVTKNKSDSAFAKSYFQAVFESQYKWKWFSFGARYSFGLQPYIKFALPGGTQQSERSTSLQVFLRYELWKSKGKN